MKTITEKFLLYRIRAKNDPDAFGKIYDEYVRRLFRFISYKVSSVEVAEDLTSDTFLKAWQYLKDGREVQSLQALLYTVARSVVTDHYRANAKSMSDVRIDDENVAELPDLESDLALVHDIEVSIDNAFVAERLKQLPDQYREVLVMKYLDQLDTDEIAEVLGKTNSTVRVLVHRALASLQQLVTHARETNHNPS